MGNPNLEVRTETEKDLPPPFSSTDERPSIQQSNCPDRVSPDDFLSRGMVAIDECIIHLKLLSAIANLRNIISKSDKLFGIHDREAGNFSDRRKQTQAITRIREKRWAVYVARAVDRFSSWWQLALPSLEARRISSLNTPEAKIEWSSAMMPPLDIVMVWHAFMLNPRSFMEDCLRQSKMSTWATGLPWDVINESIDHVTLEFCPGNEARVNFETTTGRPWENMHEGPTKFLSCPKCKETMLAEWSEGSIGCDPDVAFAHCAGYADKNFRIKCQGCKYSTTHDGLSVQSFRNDVQSLLKDDLPMPGTLLSPNGVPNEEGSENSSSFPNRLIKDGIRSEILLLTDLTQNDSTTIETIRDRLEGFLKDRSLIRRVNGSKLVSRHLIGAERVSVRNMLSRYWDNSSPFAINLIGAVIRQGTFVRKMNRIGWIKSPSLRSTIGNFINKYETFFQIISKNKGHAVVPTLDVDLIWHTHQLSPGRYYAFSTTQTEGIFVNHDDKIDEFKLNDAFAWTSKQYQKLSGGHQYSECTCRYCEAVRETHNQGLSRLMMPSNSHNSKSNAPPSQNGVDNSDAHISSHNSIRIQSQTDPNVKQAETARLIANWKKSQRRERNPIDENAGEKFESPYMRDPEIHPEIYSCNPVCGTSLPGAAGNCISGTQGAGLDHGACVSGSGEPQTRGRGKSFCAGIAGCGMTI